MLQWGRGLTAAEYTTAAASTMSVTMLQWGRGLTAAGGYLLYRMLDVDAELQWGRALTAAGGKGRDDLQLPILASMGPRPDGRGRLR